MCFWNAKYMIFFPLILYNMYPDFKKYTLLALPLLLINPSILALLLAIMSLYLSIVTYKYNIMLEENKTIRDSLTEDTLYLRKYSEQLKVDREKNIHIAILTERNRIARELHDSIGHYISSAILQTEALKMLSPQGMNTEGLDVLQNTLENGMEDIRKSIHNLYSESLDLRAKVYQLSEDIPKLDMTLNYNLSNELNYELKFDILSIIKEAMTNCAKHSNASELTISLFEQPTFYSIVIKDNGNIFDHEVNILSKGIGLSSMTEIANKYGGFINYGFDNGFKVHATLMKG